MHKKSRRMKLIFALTLALFVAVALAAPALAAAEGAPAPEAAQADNSLGLKAVAAGIAVGLATNIPTHNLGEVIDGCCAFIDNPRISLADMMNIIPGPDFSTGGFIIANELKQAYETGKGKITLRARYTIEQGDR